MPYLPSVTRNLLLLSALFFLASLALPRIGIDLFSLFALHFPATSLFLPWQPLTYLFLHGSFSHLFFNMFALYIFGRVLEDRWGSKPFLLFYLLAGVGAAATQILAWLASLYAFASAHGASLSHLLAVDPSISFLSAIGASGSIFAILFAFALTFPNAPLYIMFIPIPLKAKYVVAVYILIELVAAFAHIQGDLIAHFAHLGGILFAFLLLRLPPWKP